MLLYVNGGLYLNTIKIFCPSCGAHIEAGDVPEVEYGECAECGEEFLIPRKVYETVPHKILPIMQILPSLSILLTSDLKAGGERRRFMALAGSVILALGVFCPLIKVPMLGTINSFQNGKGDGVVVLLLAALAFLCAGRGLYRLLLLPWGGAALLLGNAFYRTLALLREAKAASAAELEGNPFAGLAEMVIGSVELQWGWAVMAIGLLLIISAVVMPKDLQSV